MVIILSYIIAIIITLVLAIILYPISTVFFLVGSVGKVIYKLGDFIFKRTNKGIKKLWSDIKHTKIVRDNTPNKADVEISEVFEEAEKAINSELEKTIL